MFGGQGRNQSPEFWAQPLRIAHGILTILLMALSALHVTGALYRQFEAKFSEVFKREAVYQIVDRGYLVAEVLK